MKQNFFLFLEFWNLCLQAETLCERREAATKSEGRQESEDIY